MTGYDIYRGGSFLKSVAATTASDTGLSGSTTYSYYVKAKDAAGNQSVSSNTVSATTQSGGIAACSGALTSAAAIQGAMINASAGTIITIAPGTYSGIRAASGDPRLDANGVPTGVFYSGASGTSGSRIILKGCDPANPPILQGPATNDGSYGIHLTGDYWEIRDIKVTRAQKGIMIDNGNYNFIFKAEIYNVATKAFISGTAAPTIHWITPTIMILENIKRDTAKALM